MIEITQLDRRNYAALFIKVALNPPLSRAAWRRRAFRE